MFVNKKEILSHIWIPKTEDNQIIIKKIIEKNLCNEQQANLYLKEYHKFMYCLSKQLNNQNQSKNENIPLFPSPIVNRIWRQHQLFTLEYPQFCQKLGFSFISYNPSLLTFWDKTEEETNKIEDTYNQTLKVLQEEFQEDIEEEVWPKLFQNMVKQSLLSFNVNVYTLQQISPIIDQILSQCDINNMTIQEIKDVILPLIRYQIPQFKESEYSLNQNEKFDQKTLKIYNAIKLFEFPQQMKTYMENEYLLSKESVQYLLNEYKKFFTMGLINKDFSQVPSGFVDEAWHTHINFFKSYIQICMKTLGQMFNHAPATGLEENEQEAMKEEFDKTMSLYENLFGQVNEQYWQVDKKKNCPEQKFIWIDIFNKGSLSKNNYIIQHQCFDCLRNDDKQIQQNNQAKNNCESGKCSGESNTIQKSCGGGKCSGGCNTVQKNCRGGDCSGECNTVQKSCGGGKCSGGCNTIQKNCGGGDCSGECNTVQKSCGGEKCSGGCNTVQKNCGGGDCSGECNTIQKSCGGGKCSGGCNTVQKNCGGGKCSGGCNTVQKSCGAGKCNGQCNTALQMKNQLQKTTKNCGESCSGECSMRQNNFGVEIKKKCSCDCLNNNKNLKEQQNTVQKQENNNQVYIQWANKKIICPFDFQKAIIQCASNSFEDSSFYCSMKSEINRTNQLLNEKFVENEENKQSLCDILERNNLISVVY